MPRPYATYPLKSKPKIPGDYVTFRPPRPASDAGQVTLSCVAVHGMPWTQLLHQRQSAAVPALVADLKWLCLLLLGELRGKGTAFLMEGV